MLRLIESMLRNISGPVGFFLRRVYYNLRLGKCGQYLIVSEGVFIDSPKDVELGDHVWLDRNVVIIAGKLNLPSGIPVHQGHQESMVGKIIIGSNVHIGIGTILQGHGGISIQDGFTTSAYVSLYTLSNNPYNVLQGTRSVGNHPLAYQMNQLRIGKNVWLGLHVSVVGGSIGQDTFVKPNAVVTKDIEPNSIVEGFPAQKIGSRFTEND